MNKICGLAMILVQSVFVTSALASNVASVDMTKKFQSIEVDMADVKTAKIFVEDLGARPKVVWNESEGEASQCLDVKISIRKSKSVYAISLTPEFNMDDGLNECIASIQQPNGKTAQISMSIYLED